MLRPVIYFDLFQIENSNIKDFINNVYLLLSLAYSKMMFPGVNEEVVLVVDTAFQHFVG